MKITRTEEGRYVRITTLTIDEKVVERINEDLANAIVTEGVFKALTEEEIVGMIMDSVKAPRAQEEYFIELEFYQGNIKLGDFVTLEINDIFEEAPADELHEEPEVWSDEVYP